MLMNKRFFGNADLLPNVIKAGEGVDALNGCEEYLYEIPAR